MSKRSQTLRALVTERLTAAAEEIFELVERTIAEYEEELCRSKEENQRQKQQQEQVLLHGFQINLPTQDDAEPSRHQDIPETPLIKEEPEEPSVKQEDEQLPQFTETPPKTDNIVITKVSSLCDVSEKQNHAEAGSVRTVPTTRTQTPDTPAQMETEADGDRDPSHRNKPETRAGGKHECPFCTKSFMSKQKLETHVRVHTGQRPFSCSICAKTFARKDHLDVHMRTHTGERAHSCSEAPSGGSSSATGSTVKFNVQYREKKTHMNLNGRSYSTFLTEAKQRFGIRRDVYLMDGTGTEVDSDVFTELIEQEPGLTLIIVDAPSVPDSYSKAIKTCQRIETDEEQTRRKRPRRYRDSSSEDDTERPRKLINLNSTHIDPTAEWMERMERMELAIGEILTLLREMQNGAYNLGDEVLAEPCKTAAELDGLNHDLEQPEKRRDMVKFLASLGGGSPGVVVRRMLRRIANASVLSGFSLCGRKGKRAFQTLPICRLLILACQKNFPQIKSAEVEELIGLTLKFAPHRKSSATAQL
uniref:C2H2-type domain-containing protein n=1 Tax=Neogobius melanostomus TaxID=47308 RepID=A0A8C6WRF6_9GOBI